jgi:hypothetical protein
MKLMDERCDPVRWPPATSRCTLLITGAIPSMKRCPKCNLKYDDTLAFCLEDGASLIRDDDPDATLVLSYLQPPRPALPGLSPDPTKSRSNRLLYGIILLLAVFAAGVTVALFYERDKPLSKSAQDQSVSSNNAQENNATQQSRVEPTPLPTSDNRQRYTSTSCGSIQDARTNLEWYVGPDRNVSWYDAQQWTTGLRSCGGGWRMPSVAEIQTLYDPNTRAGTGYYNGGRYFPAHIDPVFDSIGGGSWVWSDQQVGGNNARSFNLNQGKAVEYSTTNTTFSTRAFAVRTVRN